METRMPALPTERVLGGLEVGGRPLRLLIVESDRVVRDALREAFEMEGFRVVSAAGVGDVESLLDSGAFDCLLVDVQSEAATAWEAVTFLRDRSQARLGVMSVQSGLVARAKRFGADQFWQKPLEPGEVAEWIRREACPRVAG
jgi:DNA-binding response OmpR family regulator